jgi:putative DNA primase/helicase
MLTGGDKISARFMRQDFFEFSPAFKLMISGNHKPGLRSVDEAMRRRFNLVPFTVTIPPDRRDKDLGEKLKAEWPGILSWMIKGCADWQQRNGLAPSAVTEATDNYLQSEDAIKQWLDECCRKDPAAWTSSGILYESWKRWAEAMGEYVVSSKRLSQKLEDHGFAPVRRDQRGFRGLTIYRLTEGEIRPKLIWQPPF